MALHSSTLAWRIPWTEEPGGLQSMGLQSQTRLSDFTFTFHFHALEKEMATHSSVLPWRIPGTEEPVGLPSMGSHRVGHEWRDLAAAAVVLEKTLEIPLEYKEIKPLNPKGNQPRIFVWRTDAEPEAAILWPHDAKSWLIEKDSDAGKDWRQRRRGWDGWMASWTSRTWVWVNCGSWWCHPTISSSVIYFSP